MAAKKTTSIPADVMAAARRRAAETRRRLEHKPGPAELLTPQELADAAPFYFVLRAYIRQLKEARESAELTLADVAARTGMAVESLSRLETGAQTNPTWKTLGLYAVAVGRQPNLTAQLAITDSGREQTVARPVAPPTSIGGAIVEPRSPNQRYIRTDRRSNSSATMPAVLEPVLQ